MIIIVDKSGASSSSPKKKGTITDVTDEYLINAKPGVGKVENQFKTDANSTQKELNSEKRHQNEIETAQWLRDEFGGDIKIMKEILKSNNDNSSADYLWNNKNLELKNPTSKKTLDGHMRKLIDQIADNPGGGIFDFSNSLEDITDLITTLEYKIPKRAKYDLDIIIKNNNALVKVYRYKK